MLLISSCKNKQEADLIIHNAKIYTTDSSFTVLEAMAIKGGKILKVGSNETILNDFSSKEIKDAGGKFIFPGFIDAHCHFLAYGLGLKQVDLIGTKSFNEVLNRVVAFTKNKNSPEESDISPNSKEWIIGRGWDQNDWAEKKYPTRKKLDSLFPNTPVILKRIDGHAAIANSTALKLANINDTTKISGGVIEHTLRGRDPSWTNMPKISACGDNCYYWEPTGLLIDNAVDLVSAKIPSPSNEKLKQALLSAQKNCLAVGLTTVDDAGLMKYEIDAIDNLQKRGELKMRVYAMISDSTPNYKHYLKSGPYKTEKLNACSFKFYADGALGSRGACLLQDYSDKKNWKGFLLNTEKHFNKYADIVYENGFQMNTHCIGDSAMRLMLYVCAMNPKIGFDVDGKLTNDIMKKRRWRIEHSQIVNEKDLELVKLLSIIPSIQPTHATSDMYWAKERLGKERIKFAYAYKQLLNAAGIVAIGTDFPVEDISPFKSFYAAVYRKDAKGFPKGGFQSENALTREETIKGMTIWAAYSNFEEKEKGSLTPGKFADFVILDTDLMKCEEDRILNTKVLSTFIGGEEVYKK